LLRGAVTALVLTRGAATTASTLGVIYVLVFCLLLLNAIIAPKGGLVEEEGVVMRLLEGASFAVLAWFVSISADALNSAPACLPYYYEDRGRVVGRLVSYKVSY